MIDEKKLIDELFFKMPREYGFESIQWFRQLIDNQPKVGEWIPVSEGLPKKKGRYLVTAFDYDGEYTATAPFNPDDKLDVEFWKTSKDIVAWQPLPEPWEGEE